ITRTSLVINNTESNSDLHVADLDGDGKQDIVYLNKVGATWGTTVIWNRYPNFVQTTTPDVTLAAPLAFLSIFDKNTTAWQLADINADGHLEFVRIRNNAGTDLDVVN